MMPSKVTEPGQSLAPQAELDYTTSDLGVLAFLWGKVGIFAFLASLAALLGMMSQQGPIDTLKFADLGAYTLTLFSIPILSAVIFVLAWVGRRHARIASSVPGATLAPIAWKIPDIEKSSLRIHVAALSVAVSLGFPMIVDVWSLAKFSHGTYYWEPPHGGTCKDSKPDPATCVTIGTVLDVLWPSERGIGDPTHTQYLYQGNKDFVPGIQPLAYLGLVVGAVGAGAHFIFIAFFGRRAAAR
jgi:hypothetical protein